MRVVIVDDHPIVRSGLEETLKAQPDFDVIATAACCKEGIDVIKKQKPDIAIVDMKMPNGSGLDLIRNCKKMISRCRFIILTSFASALEVSQALAHNVDGYILKEALPEELIAAVRIVAKDRRYYDPEIIDKVVNDDEDNPFKELTKRELDILSALARGMNNKSIAEKFFISENTVKKTHLQPIRKARFSRPHSSGFVRIFSWFRPRC